VSSLVHIPDPAVYALTLLVIARQLPTVGQRALALVRDLDDYRARR
jgi:hypothetical protein